MRRASGGNGRTRACRKQQAPGPAGPIACGSWRPWRPPAGQTFPRSNTPDTETRVRNARHVEGRSSRLGLGPACGRASSRASTRLRPRRVYGRSALATTHSDRSPCHQMYPHHACWNPRAKCTAGPVQAVLACWEMSWTHASRPHALPTLCHPRDRPVACSPFWLLGASEKHCLV